LVLTSRNFGGIARSILVARCTRISGYVAGALQGLLALIGARLTDEPERKIEGRPSYEVAF
jgi:hypothetical protein